MKRERGNKRETEGKGKKRKEGIKEEIEKGARGKLDKEVIIDSDEDRTDGIEGLSCLEAISNQQHSISDYRRRTKDMMSCTERYMDVPLTL